MKTSELIISSLVPLPHKCHGAVQRVFGVDTVVGRINAEEIQAGSCRIFRNYEVLLETTKLCIRRKSALVPGKIMHPNAICFASLACGPPDEESTYRVRYQMEVRTRGALPRVGCAPSISSPCLDLSPANDQ